MYPITYTVYCIQYMMRFQQPRLEIRERLTEVYPLPPPLDCCQLCPERKSHQGVISFINHSPFDGQIVGRPITLRTNKELTTASSRAESTHAH